jgi:hypothetical protein
VVEKRSVGVLEYWSSGVLEYWSIGVLRLGCWGVGVGVLGVDRKPTSGRHSDSSALYRPLLVRSICRPFSISNPEDRVFFMERTFMCLVRANRSGLRIPRVETLG